MSKATYLSFRVIHIPSNLRSEVTTLRDSLQLTNELLVARAVDENLSEIVIGLQTLGFTADSGTVPVRLPFSNTAGTLDKLRQASADVNLPLTQLLILCLWKATKQNSVAPQPKKRGRPRKQPD